VVANAYTAQALCATAYIPIDPLVIPRLFVANVSEISGNFAFQTICSRTKH